jgi:alkylation response protein AidB-like acyl-CoA dehydrogenase
MHGMDTSDPAAPKVVHAFLPRNTEGVTIVDTWDVVGMRATQSQDTILDGAFIPDKYISRVVAAGGAGIDLFVLGIFAWADIGFGNIYYGLARRVLDETIANLKTKTSIALTRPMIYHPEVQHHIAEMVMELEAIEPHLEKIAEDWSNGVDYGHEWGLKIVAAKHRAVEGSWKVVDTALDLAGGFGIFRRSGIERLWRDARLGRLHPANSALVHELVGKTALGINPDEQPRWG